MRKKSHISLAGYLVREMNLEEFDRHKKAFYLGSIAAGSDTEDDHISA